MFPIPSSHTYARQRLALAAVTDAAWPDREFAADLRQASDEEQREFAAYLAGQGLAGHWLARLRQASIGDGSLFAAALREREKSDVMRYLGQRRAVGIVAERFAKKKIPYALLKGAHVRELLYANPAIRPSADVDILIALSDRFKAVELLTMAGFSLRINPATVSHEASLVDSLTGIDLHWDILRPGRARRALAGDMLARREQCQDFAALRPEDELFLLLFHSVFSKYLTTPYARLAGIADLFIWGQRLPIDWQELCRLCVRYRFTTAAWLTASYLRLLTDSRVFDDFIAMMRPSAVKAAWLGQWLDKNLSSRFLDRTWFIQLFFTLPAHDRRRDALRFLGVWEGGRLKADEECQRLRQAALQTMED
jgi:hypothetical protein